MKITPRRRKIEKQIGKIYNQKGKRDGGKKTKLFKQESQNARKETHKRMRIFPQIAGSHATQGAQNRDQNKTSHKRNPLLRTPGKPFL